MNTLKRLLESGKPFFFPEDQLKRDVKDHNVATLPLERHSEIGYHYIIFDKPQTSMDKAVKNVSLEFLCKENWDAMKIVDQERMCGKCKHKVHDFRTMSNEHYQETLKKSDGPICGRFKASQLSQEFLKYAASTLVVAASIASVACTPEKTLDEKIFEAAQRQLASRRDAKDSQPVVDSNELACGVDSSIVASSATLRALDENSYFLGFTVMSTPPINPDLPKLTPLPPQFEQE